MTAQQTLGQYIRARRLDLGLSQGDLADRMNLTQSEISRMELDKIAVPKAVRLRQLADALEVDPNVLAERILGGTHRVELPMSDAPTTARGELVRIVQQDLSEWEVKALIHFLRKA